MTENIQMKEILFEHRNQEDFGWESEDEKSRPSCRLSGKSAHGDEFKATSGVPLRVCDKLLLIVVPEMVLD